MRPAWIESFREDARASLRDWCGWLAGYVKPAGVGDLWTLTPRDGSVSLGYDAVAGDQFAAAAAGYALADSGLAPAAAAKLHGLVRFALGAHVAVKAFEMPPSTLWGATVDDSNDWHAALFPAAQGILLQGRVDAELDRQMLAILAWEADYHTHLPCGMASRPWALGRKWPGRMPVHAVGESIAWTAALLQVARARMPGHAEQAAWKEAAISHALNAIGMPADLESRTVVAGRPLSKWIVGANFEPGGIQEHHHFYHPGYMGWTLASNALCLVLDEKLAPAARAPGVYLHNWRHIFERLKKGCLDNGRLIYAAGFDWNQYGYGNTRLLSAALFAALRFGDAAAARIACEFLALMRLQQRRGDGSYQGLRMDPLRRGPDTQFYAWYESIDAMTVAECLWLLDALAPESPAPAPCSKAGFDGAAAGTYVEPNARLAWHRTHEGWSSISWRAAPEGVAAVVQPLDPHAVKYNVYTAGVLEAEGVRAQFRMQWFELEPLGGDGGFWSLGRIDRGVWVSNANPLPVFSQYIGMLVLPDGLTLLMDRVIARQDAALTGSLALPLRVACDLFTDYAAELWFDGVPRTLRADPAGERRFAVPARELGVRGMTVRLLQAAEPFHVLQAGTREDEEKRRWPTVYAGAEMSLLSHEITVGSLAPRAVRRGELVRCVTQAVRFGAAAPAAAWPEVESDDPLVFAIRLPGGRRAHVNFSDAQAGPSAAPTPPRTIHLA